MRTYDAQFRIEAVKLSHEIGGARAAKELGIPTGTLDTWISKAKKGLLKGADSNPKSALSLAEENKRLTQEIKELKRVNEILSKAASFFAASQKK